ncbi:MAG: hypothetical protein H7A51_14995 [Akkermansiaceae bacterium]|nr:hypothetical protein [Akkermansiaceae bacterium]
MKIKTIVTMLATASFGTLANAAIVAQYSFEGNINDTAAGGGTADNLTYVQASSGSSAPTYTAGPLGLGGQAAVFDGNYFSAADSADLSISGNTWTIEAFVHVDDPAKDWNRLVMKWANPYEYHFALAAGNLDLYDSSVTNAVDSVNTAPATDFADGWHHLAITSSAAGAEAWIDGTSVWTGSAISLNDQAATFGLGDNPLESSTTRRLFGMMDEVLIHDSAVDQTYINGRAALLVSVPEPSGAMLASLGGLLMFLRRRR